MTRRIDQLYQPSIMQYVVCYAIWLCMAVATIFLAMQVRANLLTPVFLLPIDPRTLIVVNDATIFTFGIVALISILVMEYLLRTGLTRHNFWPRVARLIVILAIVLGLSYGVQIASVALLTAKG